MEELINKTQLSPKIIPTSSCRLGGSTKESHFLYFTVFILLPQTKVRDHHRYQPHNTKIARGEFIIKEVNTKKNHNYWENIIKYHKPTQTSISPTYTQQVVISLSQVQSIMLSMMHALDLNCQMQCGIIHQEIT